MKAESDLAACLRLVVLTDPQPAAGSLLEVVARCVDAGCRAIQLRDKRASAADLYTLAVDLLPLVRSRGGLLFVNDRWDVAVAAGADGVHLGPDDIPVHAVRVQAPPGFLIGYSTDDPDVAKQAAGEGADYLGVGAVYGTASKAGLEDEAIGAERVGLVAQASGLPCVGIGGITADNAGEVAAQGAGVAVLSSVMQSGRPEEAVRQLLRAVSRAGEGDGPGSD